MSLQVSRRIWVSGAVVFVALVLLWLGLRGSESQSDVLEADANTASPSGKSRASGSAQHPSTTQSANAAPKSAGQVYSAAWGSGPDQLGKDRPSEGAPEAPMSFAFDPAGNTVILDQINGRLVRVGTDGKVKGSTPLSVQAAQDVTVAADGTTLVLDRLVDKTVAVVAPDGTLRGELPVEGKGIEEGGGITGVFTDGNDVYVEREHGPLVKIGTTDGKPSADRTELPGRPSRDNQSFLTAGIVDAQAGRLYVNSVARPGMEHRFTREIRLAFLLHTILFLDSDSSGIVYLAVSGELPPTGSDVSGPPKLVLLCLDPLDGHPLGQVDLPPNTMPEETFRDFSVNPGGGVLYALRTESGMAYQRYDCR